MANSHLLIKAGGVTAGVAFFVFLILINSNAPVLVQAETFQTPTGIQTVISKTCQSFPPITGNPLQSICGATSTTQLQLPKNSSFTCPPNCVVRGNITNMIVTCPNGGVAINGTCPLSVVPLPTNTTMPPPPTQSTPQPPSILPPAIKLTEQISVVPIVTIVDNYGNPTTVSTNSLSFNLESLVGMSIIATHDTNTPVDHGKINIQLQIKGTPNENIVANGTFWVVLNGKQVHPMGIPWGASGLTDVSGILNVNLMIPTGVSNQYSFDINSYSSQITNAVNPLSFQISNVKLQTQKGLSYVNSGNQTLYSTQLDYEANQIIQKNSQGQFVRIYPSDDTFSLVAQPLLIGSHITCPSRGGACTTYWSFDNGPYVGTATVSIFGPNGKTVFGSIASSAIGGLGSGSSYGASGAGDIGSPVINTISNIPRNSTIEIDITSPIKSFSTTLQTPVTQHSYSYSCTVNSCSFNK